MKVGILTQPLRTNYGGLLQNYALQQILIRAGHIPETIDWKMNPFRKTLSIAKNYVLDRIKQNKDSYNIYRLNDYERSVIQRNTDYFINKYIVHTSPYTSYADFKKIAKQNQYEAYIVGSDQCWRPLYNCFLKSMYLSFTEGYNVKRIAYAASFGTDMWEYNFNQTIKFGELLKKFNIISVREDSGVKLCKDHFGVDAIHVLDPTMLLSKEDYIKLIDAENVSASKGNLFTYILDPNKKKSNFIRRAEKELGLQAFQVLPKFQEETRTKENVKKEIEQCIFPGVPEWLRAFQDAEMTIVDSFHGMVFSIIFNKPFWVIGNTNRGMARFTSLLKLFNLENRLVDEESYDTVNFQNNINWDSINKLIEVKKQLCINLLCDALSKI